MSSSSDLAPDHHHLLLLSPSGQQLCYVHCKFCDTVLAVGVPCSSLLKTVTVRCGHCSNLLSVNMRGSPHSLLSPHTQSLLEETRNAPPNLVMNHNDHSSLLPRDRDTVMMDDLPKPPPPAKRPPEKRQRVPSAYNRFIKDEIQRIKAGNPDISHREAFSAAAKNWAHFPHIHFGLMPDQAVKKPNVCQEEGDEVLMKEGFLTSANIGVSPY